MGITVSFANVKHLRRLVHVIQMRHLRQMILHYRKRPACGSLGQFQKLKHFYSFNG